MNKKEIIITAFLLLGLFGMLWLKLYFNQPVISYSGSSNIPELESKVEVFTDRYGVPHVFAENEQDLMFMSGYLTARERLFQLSLRASAGRGELASFLGDDLVSSDIYLRTFGIPSVARRITANTDKKTLSFLRAYCAGINKWIDESEDQLPIEFKILKSKPVKWKPSDVVASVRLMARELQQSWRIEIVMGLLVEKLGVEKVRELFPLDADDIKIVPIKTSLSSLFQSMKNSENQIRSIMHSDGSVMGSNNMVVGRPLTKSGKPILTNDPHLGTSQPAWWYEMHLKGGDINVSGICLPGLPLPVIGQNEFCAWGFTNVMADDMDFFVETLHPENKTLYKHKGEWKTIEEVEETIPLKSGGEKRIIIRKTVHGPIISDIHDLIEGSNTAVSMAWVGNRESNEIKALLEMSYIKNWEDYSKVVKQISIPGQNIVYADINGNIGWRPAVKIPIRKEGNSLIPRPGESGEYDWTGFVPFDEMPYLLNPDAGFIVTANNKTIDDSYPYYISNQFAPPSRAIRFTEMVTETKNITIEDVKKMLIDQLSPQSREITRYFLQSRSGTETGNLKFAYDLLADWDFIESPNSQAALVFHVAFSHLLKNIYGDELNEIEDGILEDFLEMPMVPIRSLLALLRSGSSSWFDNV